MVDMESATRKKYADGALMADTVSDEYTPKSMSQESDEDPMSYEALETICVDTALCRFAVSAEASSNKIGACKKKKEPRVLKE